MFTRRRRLARGLVATATIVATFVASDTAGARPAETAGARLPAEPERLDQTLRALSTGDLLAAGVSARSSARGLTVRSSTGEVATVPADPALGIETVSGDGTNVTMHVPSDHVGRGTAIREEGAMVYEGEHDVSVVGQVTEAGVRSLLVLGGGDAPSDYRFEVEAPDGSRLHLLDDGSGELTREVVPGIEVTQAILGSPWAVGADGDRLPTRYELRGMTLTQVIDHDGATYPVVADPEWTWGWVTGTIYFTRSETNRMTTASGVLSVLGGLCAAASFTGPIATALCAGFAAHSAVIASFANQYYNEGKCLKLKVPTFEPGSVQRGDRNCD